MYFLQSLYNFNIYYFQRKAFRHLYYILLIWIYSKKLFIFFSKYRKNSLKSGLTSIFKLPPPKPTKSITFTPLDSPSPQTAVFGENTQISVPKISTFDFTPYKTNSVYQKPQSLSVCQQTEGFLSVSNRRVNSNQFSSFHSMLTKVLRSTFHINNFNGEKVIQRSHNKTCFNDRMCINLLSNISLPRHHCSLDQPRASIRFSSLEECYSKQKLRKRQEFPSKFTKRWSVSKRWLYYKRRRMQLSLSAGFGLLVRPQRYDERLFWRTGILRHYFARGNCVTWKQHTLL